MPVSYEDANSSMPDLEFPEACSEHGASAAFSTTRNERSPCRGYVLTPVRAHASLLRIRRYSPSCLCPAAALRLTDILLFTPPLFQSDASDFTDDDDFGVGGLFAAANFLQPRIRARDYDEEYVAHACENALCARVYAFPAFDLSARHSLPNLLSAPNANGSTLSPHTCPTATPCKASAAP